MSELLYSSSTYMGIVSLYKVLNEELIEQWVHITTGGGGRCNGIGRI